MGLSKSKIYYLLLGIGIGIVITSSIYFVTPNEKYKEYTNEEIIKRAKELGMVSLKERISIEDKDNQPSEQDETIPEKININIEQGDTTDIIAEKLFGIKLISDIGKFKSLVNDMKVETRFQVGSYDIDKNTDYENIIKILTKR